MAAAYSMDLRTRVLKDADARLSSKDLAERYHVSRAWVDADFNPIEQAFAKLKAFLRAARPRTCDHVTALVAAALERFTPTECRNYVRHCGYRLAVQL